MEKFHIKIKGLSVTTDKDNEETAYFYNEKMLSYGYCIEASDEELGYDKKIEYITKVTVYYLGKDDAIGFHVYNGSRLENIQAYRIVKDIFELFNEDAESFRETIDGMSSTFLSSADHEKRSNAIKVRGMVKDIFDTINQSKKTV